MKLQAVMYDETASKDCSQVGDDDCSVKTGR